MRQKIHFWDLFPCQFESQQRLNSKIEVSSLEKTNWGFGVSKKATQVFQHNLRTKRNQNQHPQNGIFPHRFHSSQKAFYPSKSGGEEFLLIDAQDTWVKNISSESESESYETMQI